VQSDIQQHYATTRPGEVQVLGLDLWNGTIAQLAQFKVQTGATFPLALNGASAAGGNLEVLYGTYDNYIVLNKQGVVRYHAALAWPHGTRYHLDEIRACVDSLVAPTLDAPGSVPATLALSAGPNPTRGEVRVSLALPATEPRVRVSVHDVAGRELAVLADGPAAAGRHEWSWDGRDARGTRVAPGLYLIRAAAAEHVRTSRVVLAR
jgi:hypothetical protein